MVRTDDVLTVTASGTDPEGSGVQFTYRWLVDGAEVLSDGPTASAQSSLDGASYFSKGQTVQAEVVPNDGMDDGAADLSALVSVANSAPTAPVVTVSPAAPEDYEDIVCAAAGSTDADGDAVTYSYSWTQDGVARPDLDGQDTAPSSETSLGEAWECTVEAGDGLVDEL